MNHRQRVRAVMHYEKIDRMPCVAFGYWTETVDKWADEGHISRETAELCVSGGERIEEALLAPVELRAFRETGEASTALWRRDRLLALLREGEDAWQFEGGASRRSMYDRHEYYSYEGKPDWPAPIIDCAQHVYRGYGVFRGKWLWNNEEFFKENGISVDFSVRGVLTEDEFTKLREENIKKACEQISKTTD